jgi:hypothetical protein
METFCKKEGQLNVTTIVKRTIASAQHRLRDMIRERVAQLFKLQEAMGPTTTIVLSVFLLLLLLHRVLKLVTV